MNEHDAREAARLTAEAADRAAVRPEYDGRRFVPVRGDHLTHLIKVMERQERILTALCRAHDLDPKDLA